MRYLFDVVVIVIVTAILTFALVFFFSESTTSIPSNVQSKNSRDYVERSTQASEVSDLDRATNSSPSYRVAPHLVGQYQTNVLNNQNQVVGRFEQTYQPARIQTLVTVNLPDPPSSSFYGLYIYADNDQEFYLGPLEKQASNSYTLSNVYDIPSTEYVDVIQINSEIRLINEVTGVEQLVARISNP